MQTAGAAPAAAAGVPGARAARPRTLRLGTMVSIVVHGGLLAAALAVPTRRMLDDERVTIDIVDAPVPRPAPAVEPSPPKPPLLRAVMTKRARPIETPVPAPAAPPPPLEELAPAPSPPVASAPTTETTRDLHAVRVAAAPAGAGISGGGPVAAGGRGPAGAAPTESHRRSLSDRYRDELLRTRIRDRFRYPPEALELELTGRVVVQVTIDRRGRLLDARLSGACPHPLLCEDGLRTVRAAAPFPAPPPDLGDTLRIEIPLNYELR